MKTNYILAIFAFLLLASCQKDFLDPDSISTFDNKYIYSNVDDARKGVNAVYSYFQQDAFRSRLSNNMCGNTDIERQSGWGSTSDRHQIWDLNALETNGDLNIVWTYAYRAIGAANISIEGIKASGNLESSDASVKRTFNQLLGECYVLRAYWYSMLSFYFGDVPYVINVPAAGQNFNIPKSNRNEILSQEIQNIIDIEDKMLWADQLPYGIEQVNREYALGMIARLSLQRGGYYLTPELNMVRDSDYLDYYQIAKDYSAKLISLKDRPLPTDFKQIFMNECKFITRVNEEVLWEVPFPKGSGDVGWNIGITVIAGEHNYGGGNNYMGMPPTYYLSFDGKDKRRDVTCGLYQYNAKFVQEVIPNANNISQGKWSRAFLTDAPGKQSAKGTGINWPMMRYADVLLMYAEAENELNGPTADAQNTLKRVRQRAFDQTEWITKVDGYVTQASVSKTTFFNAIVDERAWEFGGEMIRKYELIRWGIYSDKMKKTVDDLKKLADDAFSGAGTGPDYLYWKLDDKGNFIVLNPNTKVAAAPDDTWKRQAFLIQLHNNTTIYQDWILKDYANYYLSGPQPGVARYIYPIPAISIATSEGTLNNDGYKFK